MDINKAFRHACDFIFGQEMGDIDEYEQYLIKPVIGKIAKSSFSDQELFLTSNEYCKDARFFNYENELDEVSNILRKPLNINEIKDIDSLLSAVQEKGIYAGGKVLGKSTEVVQSDNVHNSQEVYYSSFVYDSKYVAYSHKIRNSEYVFACACTGEDSWIMRSVSIKDAQRCFECSMVTGIYDCYFCYNIHNCNECMFSFHSKSKHNMIGNIVLERDEYRKIKQKLLEEIIDLMKNNKLDFSILNLPEWFGWDNE